MKVMWLLYDSTYALIDIRCGAPDVVDREVANRVRSGDAYIAIRIRCDGGKYKAEVYKVREGDLIKDRELSVDGKELIYPSVTRCSERGQDLKLLLRDIYRGGVSVTEERSRLMHVSEVLGCG